MLGEEYLKNIWVPISGQIAQQRKVETIANNIANANTAGFKKDSLTFKEYLTVLDKGSDSIDLPRKEWDPDDFYRTQGAENAYVKVDGTYTNFAQGQLTPTHSPFDLALFGKGMFEVATSRGARYTRNGSFTLTKEGFLANARGEKLLMSPASEEQSLEDRYLQILPGENLSISKEGRVFTQRGEIGQLAVVEFKDLHALRKEGNNLYINNDISNIKRENIATAVHQGFTEGSNVNAVKEMAELIKAQRHFDSIQQAIKAYDDISGRAVNDISKF